MMLFLSCLVLFQASFNGRMRMKIDRISCDGVARVDADHVEETFVLLLLHHHPHGMVRNDAWVVTTVFALGVEIDHPGF